MKKILYLIGAVAYSSLAAQVNLISDLKVCMPFNGNATDMSGNSNHGTVFNSTLTTDRFGNVNNAYQFSNSAGSYISIENFSAIAPTNELTISLWAKADFITSNCLFILNPDNQSDRCVGCAQYINGSGTAMIWDYGDLQSGGRTAVTSIAPDANWHHYVYIISQSANIKQMYLDGSLVSNSSYSLSCLNKNLPFYIGGGFSNGGNTSIMWNGKIDDVYMYNRALNTAEVSTLYYGFKVCSSVGIKEARETLAMSIYPAVSAEGLYGLSSSFQEGRVEIYSQEGKLVRHYNLEANTLKMDLSQEPGGMYYVKLITPGEVYVNKIIKSN
jgi:hypothetical protein